MRTVADERTAVAGALASLLAAATLSPLVAGITWLVVAGVIVVTVMVAGIIARHLLKHPVPVLVIQALVLLIALEVLFARSRLLDGPGAVTALTDLLAQGLEVTRTQPPPVEATQGVILLAAGGTGAVALLVDILACTLRQPALAGLPLLAIYCVPAALLPDGLPWYYFAAAAAGFMLLLSADSGERIQSWGRVLSAAGSRRFGGRAGGAGADGGPGGPAAGPQYGSGEGLSALAGIGNGGRRAAAAAVAAAILLPALMPGLGNQIIGGTSGTDGEGNGSRTSITRINPILNLKNDLVSGPDKDIISYRTDAPQPEPLRIVTADIFDGRKWSPNLFTVDRNNKAQTGLPSAPGLGGGVRTTSRNMIINVTSLEQSYLPLPYPTTTVDVKGEWLYDPGTLNVIGKDVTTRNLNYSADYLDVQPTSQQLATASAASLNLPAVYRELPENLPAVIGTRAAQITQGSASPYEQAVKIQDWLREGGGFTYSTEAPVSPGAGDNTADDSDDSSSNSIVAFLQQRRGYCVHFASTMAVMARTLGIPARVGIGFLPGEKQPGSDEWVISVRDAHAWPELYFQGVGWVRFEPTPRSNLTPIPSWAVPPAADPQQEQSTPTPSASSAPQTSAAPSAAATTAAPDTAAGGGGVDVPWRLVLIVLVLVGALVTPLLAVVLASSGRWRRATTPAARAEAAWTDLRLGLEDLGATWAWTWTPRTVQERLTSQYDLGDAGRSALGRLVTALEAARYAPPGQPGAPEDALTADLTGSDPRSDSHSDSHSDSRGGLRDDARTVLARIAATVPRGRRVRARFFPPSAGTALSSLLTPRRGGSGGPDDEALAAGSGKDTLEQDPGTGRQRTRV